MSRWIAAVKRDKWQPNSTDTLCSVHFEETCFRIYNTQVRLRENAVPSLFSFPKHLLKKAKERRAIRKHNTAQVSSSSSAATSTFLVPDAETVKLHHNYALMASPRGIKRKYAEMVNREKHNKQLALKKLKVARRRLFRQQQKLKSMKDVIKQLKSMRNVNRDAVDLIEHCFGNIPAELLNRKLHRKSKEAYSDVLRSFAMTLNFYSAKAYNFVRKSFKFTLPHPSTLRSWYSAVDGKPGFTTEALEVRCD